MHEIKILKRFQKLSQDICYINQNLVVLKLDLDFKNK